MKPSKTGKPLPKSQLDFECDLLRPLEQCSIFTIQLNYYIKIPPFRQLEIQKALSLVLDRQSGACYIYFKFEVCTQRRTYGTESTGYGRRAGQAPAFAADDTRRGGAGGQSAL